MNLGTVTAIRLECSLHWSVTSRLQPKCAYIIASPVPMVKNRVDPPCNPFQHYSSTAPRHQFSNHFGSLKIYLAIVPQSIERVRPICYHRSTPPRTAGQSSFYGKISTGCGQRCGFLVNTYGLLIFRRSFECLKSAWTLCGQRL